MLKNEIHVEKVNKITTFKKYYRDHYVYPVNPVHILMKEYIYIVRAMK